MIKLCIGLFRVAAFMLLVHVLLGECAAQNVEFVKESKEPSEFKQNLWYGGGAALAFASSNIQSDFLLGVFPMAGYHLTDQFSAGFRAGLSYTFTRIKYRNGDTRDFHPIDYSFGPLARYMIYRPIFAHGEVEFASDEYVLSNGQDFFTVRDPHTNVYIGLGYNPGGFEFMLLYNLNENTRSGLDVPIEFRAGFTINY